MIIILKLISLIYVLTFALKPFEMMEMTSEYLKLIPIKKRSDCTTKHLFMTLVLTGRFVVLYSVFFYQIVNDFVRLITQDQVTIKQKTTERHLPLKKVTSVKRVAPQPTTECNDKSIHLDPTPLSNNTTSNSAPFITEPMSTDSPADTDLDVSEIKREDDHTRYTGNVTDTPIEINDAHLEEAIQEVPELSDNTKEVETAQQPIKAEFQEELEVECEKEKAGENQAEEDNVEKIELIEEGKEEEDTKNVVKQIEEPKKISEEKQAKDIEIKEIDEENKKEEVKGIKINEIKEELNEQVKETKVQESKEQIESTEPEQFEEAKVQENRKQIESTEPKQVETKAVEKIKAEKNKDEKVVVQPTTTAQEELDQVVEEFPMAPNNEPQQAPSASLKSSRRISEGSATPALTTSSSGSPASRRSSYNSSVMNTQQQQPSKLLSKIKATEEQQPISQPLPERPPSRFLSLRIGSNKNKSSEEPPQPKVSMSSKLKSSFKFMKKVKGSSKRSSQLLQ